jgi:hypothetical protein
MIQPIVKTIMGHFRLPSQLVRGAAAPVVACLALSVLLAISSLQRVIAQPRSGNERQTNESLASVTTPQPQRSNKQITTIDGQSELLPYDLRPRTPASQLPRGFHKSKDLIPRPSGGIGIPADIRLAGSQSHERPLQPSGTCPSTITQSTSQAIVTGSVACSEPAVRTLENHYWRTFDMATFTGGQAYNITSVEFGIEQASAFEGTQPITVNLYTNNGAPFPSGDWQSNLLATSGVLSIPDQKGTIFNVPITATVPAGTLELVMEVMAPDTGRNLTFFIIGSNPDPETGLSYLSAPDCGNPVPSPVECFLGPMHYVFNVNGSCAGGAVTPTPTPTATPSCPPTVIAGNIDNSDPTQTDRLFRDGFPDFCACAGTCFTVGAGAIHYDAYTFTNTTGSAQCVTVAIDTDCQGNNFIFAAAYLGTFDPNNICTNWIADEGQSPIPGNTTPFSFNIEGGQTFVLVVSEVTANAGCPSYTTTVSGLCGGGIPTPTPTATATPTPTATETPTPTPTATARPVPTPRPHPTPRTRPTPPEP